MILSALIAKFLSAGAVAQAATGATVAVVAFTGVGAVGALPGPVQDTFATVVAEITPLEPPTSEETTEGTTEEVVADETLAEEDGTTDETTDETTEVPEAGVVDVQAWIDAGPADHDSFGAWVSASAQHTALREALRAEGKNFGSVISKWARDKGMDDEDLAAEGVVLAELTDAPVEVVSDVAPEAVTETEQAEVAATEDRGSRGNGNAGDTAKANGNGNGKGNGKN